MAVVILRQSIIFSLLRWKSDSEALSHLQIPQVWTSIQQTHQQQSLKKTLCILQELLMLKSRLQQVTQLHFNCKTNQLSLPPEALRAAVSVQDIHLWPRQEQLVMAVIWRRVDSAVLSLVFGDITLELPLFHSHSQSLSSSLPQISWKKRAPCWPRQAVRFCKLTALIMSFCYSDTRSALPPHWLKSQPVGEAGQRGWLWYPPSRCWHSIRRWKES